MSKQIPNWASDYEEPVIIGKSPDRYRPIHAPDFESETPETKCKIKGKWRVRELKKAEEMRGDKCDMPGCAEYFGLEPKVEDGTMSREPASDERKRGNLNRDVTKCKNCGNWSLVKVPDGRRKEGFRWECTNCDMS